MSQRNSTVETDAPTSIITRIMLIIFALAAFGLAYLMWTVPLQDGDGEITSHRAKYVLFLFVLKLLWGPFGAVLSALFGLMLGAAALTPNKKTEQAQPARTKPIGSSASVGISSSTSGKGPQPAQGLAPSKRSRTRIIALVPSNQLKLETVQLQTVLEHQGGQNAPNVEIIEFPSDKPGQWWARARFGEHSVRLIGKPEAVFATVQARTIFSSLIDREDKTIIAKHQAHIELHYERGTDDTLEQLLALHTVAAAYLEHGLYGVIEEGIGHVVTRQDLEFYNQSKLLRERLIPELAFGRSRHPQDDGKTWFVTRGHERANLPNLAFLGSDTDDKKVEKILNNLTIYMHQYEAVIEAGHTAEAAGHFLGFSDPHDQMPFPLEGRTLIVHLENARAFQPDAPTVSGERREPNAEETEWILKQVKQGMRVVMGTLGRNDFSNIGPDMAVDRAAKYIIDIQTTLGRYSAREYSESQLEATAVSLGILWGHLSAFAYGNAWLRDESGEFVLHDSAAPQAQTFAPIQLIRDIVFGKRKLEDCTQQFKALPNTLKPNVAQPNETKPNETKPNTAAKTETPAQTIAANTNEPLEPNPHRTLSDTERQRLQKYIQHGLRMVSSMIGRNDLELTTTSQTNAVNIVQDIQSALEKIKARGLNTQQLENAATVIGTLWGEVATLTYGYEWFCDDSGSFELVSAGSRLMPSNTAFTFSPVGLIRGILLGENPVAQCTELFTQVLGAARSAVVATTKKRESEDEIPGMSFSLN